MKPGDYVTIDPAWGRNPQREWQVTAVAPDGTVTLETGEDFAPEFVEFARAGELPPPPAVVTVNISGEDVALPADAAVVLISALKRAAGG